MKDLKKLLLGAAATTAAAGVFFASDAAVAQADAYVTPVDENGNVILGGNPDGNPAENTPENKFDENGVPTTVTQPTEENTNENTTETPDVKPVEEDNSSNLFKPGVDKDGVPTSVSGNEAVEQPEEVVEEDPYHSPYEYEAETKEAAIEIGEAMLKRSELEGTALAEVNNHVDAVQTASGKWAPQFSYVEKEETPAEENEKPAEETEKTLEDLFDFSGLAEETEEPAEETEKSLEDLFDFSGLVEEDPEFEFDPDKAYDTLADAFVAAETAIKNDPVNEGYDIQVGADGKYYIQLQVEANTELEDLFDFSKLEKEEKEDKDEKAEETEKDAKKEDPKVVVANEKDQKADKEAKAEKANAKLPATGVVAGSVAGLGVALIAAGSALSFRRRK